MHRVMAYHVCSEQFGLSNYMSFEVAEIVGICERRGFVKPTVYEGVYNILDRNTEAECVFASLHDTDATDADIPRGSSRACANSASNSVHTAS